MNDWQRNKSWQHWTHHSITPVLLVLLLLIIPKSWLFPPNKNLTTRTVSIELSTATTAPEIPYQVSTEPKEKEQKANPSTSQSSRIKTPQQSNPNPVVNKTPEKQIIKKATPKKETLNSRDVQMMMLQAVDPKLTDSDFLSKKNQNQFLAKQYIAKDNYADLPYLDESIDAPRVQMAFYSPGFMGNVEKFFDKITYKKTFTTKYGTKIHCALVGVIAMCGWK
ncbi:hypothetical protein [Marinicella rhabdoformis]|uniref:hypothetical protein n=1 Tax=Marinicella rhabdoformis TaxID=2580566 RepID=UPI0012AEB465|nr:hypothetical protein [Marinicella rhabdoformis]